MVDDPRSRKAQFMMTHLMSKHKAALSQRLNHIRTQPSSSEMMHDDELQILGSLETLQLTTLPPDVVKQVMSSFFFYMNQYKFFQL